MILPEDRKRETVSEQLAFKTNNKYPNTEGTQHRQKNSQWLLNLNLNVFNVQQIKINSLSVPLLSEGVACSVYTSYQAVTPISQIQTKIIFMLLLADRGDHHVHNCTVSAEE